MKKVDWKAELDRAWRRYVLDLEVEQEVIRQGARESAIALAEQHTTKSFNFYMKLLVASRGGD